MKKLVISVSCIAIPLLMSSCPVTEYHTVSVYEFQQPKKKSSPAPVKKAPLSNDPGDFKPVEKF